MANQQEFFEHPNSHTRSTITSSESKASAPLPAIEAALLYKAVAQASDDAIYAQSLDGTIVDWNPGAQRLLGFRADDVIGRNAAMLFPEDRRDEFQSLLRRIALGERIPFYETAYCRKDGLRINVRLSIVPVRREGQSLGASVIAYRISSDWHSDTYLHSLLEAIPHGLVMADPSGQIRLVNAEIERMFGFEPSELVGAPIEYLMPVRLHQVHTEHRQAFTRHPTTRPMGAGRDLVGRRKDGSEFPVEVGLNPIETAEGLYTLAAVVDITERRQALAAIREAQEKLSALVEHLPIGVSILDANLRLLYANPTFERLMDRSQQELQALAHLNHHYLQPDGQLMELTALASTRALAEQRPVFDVETGILRNDGSVVWTSMSAAPVDFSDWKLVVTITDISERKNAETILKASEERFIKTFHANPIAILLIRALDTQIVDVNAALLLLLGYSKEEVVGKPLGSLDIWTDQERHDALLEELLYHGQLNEEEIRIQTNAGDIRDILFSAEILDFGSEANFMVLLHDVTERKHVAQALENQARELQRSNADLEQFAYVASHDLQEPLRMVASYTELLAERYAGQIDEKADKYIHYAVDGARRMQQLINDLLTYSRVGRQSYDPQPTRSEVILKRVLNVLYPTIRECQAEITYSNLPVVLSEPGQLGQLFQNLLSNALKFCNECKPVIHITATRHGEECLFAITDNGIGIAPEQAERIFQMFQRLHERSRYPGSGIGLAIAKRIVERHGGQIWFTSVLGEGTTFFFTLPAAPSAAGERTHVADPNPDPANRG